MGLKRLGICIDGAAVEAGGIVQSILCVGHVTQVKQGAWIGGMSGEPGFKLGLSGFPVGFDDGCFGVYDLIGDRLGRGGRCGCFRFGAICGYLS
jgi:hypothetical protein